MNRSGICYYLLTEYRLNNPHPLNLMVRHSRFRTWLYLLAFLLSSVPGWAQTYTYPFANGVADLPAFIRLKNKPVWATYTVQNPTNKPVDVILYQEIDEMDVYRVDGGKHTLLGRAGWLYPAYLLQFANYPEFGLQHRNGVLFQLNPGQSTRIQVVFRDKTSANKVSMQPRLFSRAGYGQFLDHRIANHLQIRLLGMAFMGCLLIMFLYSGMQYIILRERLLLYYALYVLLVLLRSLVVDDYLHGMDGWPLLQSVGFVSRHSLTFMFWSFAAYGLFLHEYTGLRVRAPITDRIYCTISVFFFLLGIGDLFVSVDKFVIPAWQLAHRLTDMGLLLFSLYTLFILWRFYDPVTKFLFWGVMFLFASGAASIINRMFYGNSLLVYDIEIAIFATGYLLEILTFALGIAQRHDLVRQEKLRIQSQLIEQLLENEQKQAKLNGLRDEIARDLHDEMGSQLASISILSQTIARFVTDERASQRLTTIGQTARQVMESMREIVWSLNSSSDSMQHLGLRIGETAQALFSEVPARLHTDLAPTSQRLNLTEKQRRELHLIAKECLTNVFRHANAQHVWIMLRVESNELLLTIRDDGVGFTQATQAGGLGLRSIRMRTDQIGATLSIESAEGQGTTIRVRYLIKPASDNRRVAQLEAPHPANSLLK